jgi:hypothetical protein
VIQPVTPCESQTERNRGYSTIVNNDRASILGSLEQLLNPAKQSKQAKQASKQANQQIGLG